LRTACHVLAGRAARSPARRRRDESDSARPPGHINRDTALR
jgi:hypothetical protein